MPATELLGSGERGHEARATCPSALTLLVRCLEEKALGQSSNLEPSAEPQAARLAK